MSEFEITTAVSIISLLIGSVTAAIALITMRKKNKDDENKDLEKSVKNEMRMNRFGNMLESIQESTNKLVEGFTSNEKRISLLEHSVREQSKEISELRRKVDGR